jgi:hypothetical protein
MPTLGKLKHARGVTPSDINPLPHPSTHLSFGSGSGAISGGTLVIDSVGGEIATSISLPAGLWPICATKVYATNTTATNIVAYWED